jgi:HEAT repeat protein
MILSAQGGNDDVLATFTRAELEIAIQQTKSDATRLEGLHQLIRMAGPRLYEGSMVMGDPDPERFKLRGEAARAAADCRDVATVGAALDSPIRSVRTWALLNFETRAQFQEQWQELLPRLIRVLQDPDAGYRQMAVDALWPYPQGRRAIAERELLETDPDVLLRMARSGSSPAFYGSLIRLLSSSDAAVRESALSFIYFNLWNKATAPMWRVGFDPEVRRHVLKLSASPLPAERESALKALQQIDQEAARPQTQ